MTGYVGKNYQLPMCRKDPRGEHRLEFQGKGVQWRCFMCRYLQQQAKNRPDSEEASLFKGRIHSTSYACTHCSVGGGKVALCKERCYELWHELPA